MALKFSLIWSAFATLPLLKLWGTAAACKPEKDRIEIKNSREK
jgi:hypothetical protein